MSVAPILLAPPWLCAEMGLMKGEADLVERLSGVSPPAAAAPVVPPAAEAVAAATAAAAAAAVCSAELKAADDETALPELEASPLELLLLAFGVDDLGMKDEANGDPPFAGILVISTRSIDGEYDRPSSPDPDDP